jgi:quercetin dioxygenase-like cupin family protein
MDEAPDTTAGFSSIHDAIRFDARAPVVAEVASNGATKVFVVCLEPGQELRSHRAPAELTLLVIEGEPVVTVGDGSRPAAGGDVFLVATGALHALSAGPRAAIVVGILNQTQTPVRRPEGQEEMPQPKTAVPVDSLEILEDEAIDSNPDLQTRRETFELELMEEGRSKEGAFADLADEAKHSRSREHGQGS